MDPCLEQSQFVTRRALFGRSALGLGAVALGSLLDRDSLAAETPRERFGGLAGVPHFAPKAKRVIYLFQNGGPTHVELYDYKPKLAEEHGKPVPEAYFAGKRFSTMTGNPTGKVMLAPVEPFKQHGQSGAWVSNFMPHVASVADELC